MEIAHSYVNGKSTTCHVIKDTINAIWDNVHPIVLPMPTKQTSLDVSSGFLRRWDYPNVIGAIDGKF